jgi:hypothetical protein
MKNLYNILSEKPEGQKPFGLRREDNIKMYLKFHVGLWIVLKWLWIGYSGGLS